MPVAKLSRVEKRPPPAKTTTPNASTTSATALKSKKRRTTSCERCQRRKQKCDHKLPSCTNCLKSFVPCIQPERYSEVAESTEYTESLEAKISELEAEVKNLRSKNGICTPAQSFNTSISSQPPDPQAVSSAGPVPPGPPDGSGHRRRGSHGGHGHGHGHRGVRGVRGERKGNRVSILNSDNESAPPPQSFTVVSSLLQETYWGQAHKMQNNTNPVASDESKGLLFDYDFSEYLLYDPEMPSSEQADALFHKFLQGSHGKYAFIDRAQAQRFHDEFKSNPNSFLFEQLLTAPNRDYTKIFERVTLVCIYTLMSISDHKTIGEMPKYNPFGYYATAIRLAQQCDEFQPTWQIMTLMLFSFIQMRTDKDHGIHFEMVRKALSLCEDFGLHEAHNYDKLSLYEQEMQKRLFWAVYSLERLYAISTGRPFVLEEARITVGFPCSLEDADLSSDEKILAARQRMQNGEPEPITSMTSVIHMWRLKQFETEMVMVIYNTNEPLQSRFSKVDYFMNKLERWKNTMPADSSQQNQQMVMMGYARSVRLLVQPFLAILNPDSDLFRSCVRQTGLICYVLREYYRNRETGFTTLSTHSAFVAGLTLIYCLWLAKDSSILYILENLRCCTSVLYTLTERTRLCTEYRDTFENLMSTTVKNVIDHRGRIREQRKREYDRTRQQLRFCQLEIASRSTSLPEVTTLAERTSSPISATPTTAAAAAAAAPNGIPQIARPSSSTPLGGSNGLLEAMPPLVTAAPLLGPQTQDVSMQSQLPTPEGSQTLYQEVYQNGPRDIMGAVRPAPPPMTALMSQTGSDNYGYNDTLYNMIQDISQWIHQINQMAPPDPDSIFHDEMWRNVSEINYS